MSDLTKADLRERLGNIDQIRDILFGAQLRNFNARLDRLEKGLSVLQQDLRSQTDEVRRTLTSDLQAAVESIEKKLRSSGLKEEEEKTEIRQQLDAIGKRINSSTDELEQKFTTEIQEIASDCARQLKLLSQREAEEKGNLQQQLDLLAKRLSGNVEGLNETIDKQNTLLRDDLLATRDRLQEAILTLRTHLSEELEQSISHLTQAKVARNDMAELLLELGLRLQGTEVLSELSKAGDRETPASSPNALPASEDV